MDIILNKDQEKAAGLIENWFRTYKSSGKQIFTIGGYAGTGKTTLINYIIENRLNLSISKVAFATPTGKAAAVLVQKGAPATTIHRLIYSPVIDEHDTMVNNKKIHVKKIEFVKRKSIDNYKLIVLDEISMVTEDMMEDLLSFGIPILASGDPGQLPAIGSGHDLLKNPDYVLTEIVRQNNDSPILTIANMARNNQYIQSGDYGDDVKVIDRANLRDNEFKQYLLEADQVICGTNNMRIKLNRLIRELKGIKSALPVDDDKFICELNNYSIEFDKKYSLVNGIGGNIKNFRVLDSKLKLASISFKPDFLDNYVDNILIEYEIFETNKYKYDKHQEVHLMCDGTYSIKKFVGPYLKGESKEEYKKRLREEFLNSKLALADFTINEFQYGYAISCHKAQGSQWDSVLIIDEHNTFGQDGNKWLYTAITRAAKKVVIIR